MLFKKNYFYFTTAGILILCFYIGFQKITSDEIDIQNAASESLISATNLTTAYLQSEENANIKFKDKIIEVEGVVRSITFTNQRNTILLKGIKSDTNVICDFSINFKKQSITIGQHLKIKGICKGFLKDVILLNCMILNTQNNE